MAQVISSDGTAIGYEIVGSGPLVILISGATQYRAVDTVTPRLVAHLSAHYSVITYDRRGRGASGDTWPYSVAREVEDIAALMDAHGSQAYLFGMSSGAILALEAASVMPRSIQAVALYEPPIDPAQSSESFRIQHGQMAMLAAEGRADDMLADFLSGVGLSTMALTAFKASPAWAAYAAIGLTIEHDYRLLADARAGATPPERWQNAIMPVLVLDGDASLPFMSAGADWVAKGLHNAERLTLADQSHNYDPDVLGPLLTVFFKLGTVQVH
ncbi:hypothetical protein VW35_09255 [Devosia soli]|uniref:AB hydrolase-1 domain-containing protein n=1 Tax=Devosia soli TaxID=361041 RepID=A0A0F5L8I3_9HYPH|nr:alpha/beta hydrolase [Devosia soli]KKB78696.1 hypothetical protein VW35_09255 [Devosia soli]